jgi:beta-galactosidase/beta-glucuronidase
MIEPGIVPRSEYPRPQFVRDRWLCLNGPWQFEIDPGDSGLERGLGDRELCASIVVPFCPESELSGINNRDFLNSVWYRRTIKIPTHWSGQRVLLHFQAVDYDATVWGNGVEVGRHRGGFTPFVCDLSEVPHASEEITVVVRARDRHRAPQPLGKQAQLFHNHDCLYTRTTGIWQTVWLEPVPPIYLKRPRITPDLAGGAFHLDVPLSANRPGWTVRAMLLYRGEAIVAKSARADISMSVRLTLPIPEDRIRLWSPGDPYLYDVSLELLDEIGRPVDSVKSYAGLRSVAIDGKAIKINGNVIFQRLVLDQGYYPDGIMTAPTDEALKRDIQLSQAAGFNGARLHQKAFEERFLYWADKLGYLCWGEFADWSSDLRGPPGDNHKHPATYITQWLEAVERDYSHPCIIGWCPLNETPQILTDHITALDEVTRGMFLATKAMDTSRLVLDVSGYSHRVPEADVYDCHDYEQDPTKFAANHAGLARGVPMANPHPDEHGKRAVEWSVPYRGQPYFVSEFGGIWWNPNAGAMEFSWGYGARPASIEDFYARFEKLCNVLLRNPDMFGYCYTQLTDVYQEQNGIYTFRRETKFDMTRIRAIQIKSAAIEEASQ